MSHNEQASPNTPITWKGDLSDDCTAEWFGLMLRAERMNVDDWWWAVYDMQDVERTVDSSNEYDILFRTGNSARAKAETVARSYLKRKLGDNNTSDQTA